MARYLFAYGSSIVVLGLTWSLANWLQGIEISFWAVMSIGAGAVWTVTVHDWIEGKL